MPYLGNEPATAFTSTTKDTFSGDASTTDFTMSKAANVNAVRVVVENVVQNPTVAYTCSGTTLSFTSAPPTGTNNIYVVHLGPPAATVAPPTTINNNTTFTGGVSLKNETPEDTDGGRESKVTFKGLQSGQEESTLAEIQASHDGTSDDQAGDLIFKTNDGSDGSSPTERVRIDSSGAVGIGVSPDSTVSLDVQNLSASSNNVFIRAKNTTNLEDAGIIIDGNNGGQKEYKIGVNTIINSSNLTLSGPSGYRFFVGTDEELRIDSDGLKFNGDTSSDNALDDYEQGTWTPTAAQGATGVTVDAPNCLYTKVGKMVMLQFEISNLTSPNGSTFNLGGVPFTSAQESIGSPFYQNVDIPGTRYQISVYIGTNVNYIRFYAFGDNGGWSSLTGNNLGTTFNMMGTVVYRAS